ncbi:hypothetical protein E4N62_03365 [Streptomyces sp. MNU76]|uniref:hypothetical protein n=1 Tax=Streptomyces sp. MNU76 TaxID=2560026 RepID=UPI001E5471E2|nr:hypothetical protein [Streptomyces sp. MNU76]MCC9704387.1 hypothetical protein [Streptomyces sp. MNU76]
MAVFIGQTSPRELIRLSYLLPERVDGNGQAAADWYNVAHRHSGIAMHTPFDVHFGLADQLREMHADVLTSVYRQHPERFVRGAPEPPKPPGAAWINKPPDLRHNGQTIPAQR